MMTGTAPESIRRLFDLTGRVAVITGGAGMLGVRHAEILADAGAIPVLVDLDAAQCEKAASALRGRGAAQAAGCAADITKESDVAKMASEIEGRFGRVDILINNAALTVKGGGESNPDYFAPFEQYPEALFSKALDVNLKGAFLVTRALGPGMAARGKGVVVNIASDVAMISPDHRIYRGMTYGGKPFNTPIAYSMSKAALLAFTRYLATYWAERGVRVNALSPAGVWDGHDEQFTTRLSSLIPMGRMAQKDEYQGAILFLCSDASSFMTGANLVVDGGRTAW
jgi:NAD(P)-dependent dehydrogenase (short-subunit alcohol dehydrogenase family)